jgi:hypothetical protein
MAQWLFAHGHWIVVITMQCNNIGGKISWQWKQYAHYGTTCNKFEKMGKIITTFLSQQLFS